MNNKQRKQSKEIREIQQKISRLFEVRKTSTTIELIGILIFVFSKVYFDGIFSNFIQVAGLLVILYGFMYRKHNAKCPYCNKSIYKLLGDINKCPHCRKPFEEIDKGID